MVDYAFYRDAYLGSQIGEKEFPNVEARAAEYLNYLKHRYQVVSSGAESEKMAVCALAEGYHNHSRRGAIASASAGSVSVHYRNTPAESLHRDLFRRAGIYLDIYRGVSQ